MPPISVRPAFASSVRALTQNATPRVSQLTPRVSQPITRRFKSGPYGYTQAKALVYSQNGEPCDVLFLHTHVEAQEDALLRVEKEGLTPVQVGTVGVNPTTAYRMLKDFENVGEGEWFIQNGANSGVGRAAIQLGRLWGMKSINIIRERGTEEETEAMRNELRGLGATHVVTEGELMARGFSEQVKEWTVGGRQKVKLGLNCVGGKPTSAMVKCLSDGGHLVTYGGMAKAPLQVPTAALIFKDVKFSGFWVSRWSEKNLDEKRRTVGEILELTRAGMFADVPVQKVQWDWDTKEKTLKEAVTGTLQGFRKGKGVFVFGDT